MFKTIEEVKTYASGEKIQCLECGKQYSLLCAHLRIHGIGEKEYREKYNIPRSIKLVGSVVLGKMRESNKTPIDVLRSRVKQANNSDRGKYVRHPMFNQVLVDAGRRYVAEKKANIDEEKIKKAHEIYMRETQRAACDFLCVTPPTMHSWFDQLGLPKKCQPTSA